MSSKMAPQPLSEGANLARTRKELVEIEPEVAVMTRFELEVAFASGHQVHEGRVHVLE
jgi:hypothetical protein